MVNQCQFCGEEEALEMDKHNQGFWCEDCDGYTYFDDNQESNRFVLILEDKQKSQSKRIGKSSFKKRLSPLRFPGGKSRLIDYLHSKLKDGKTDLLVSPFTGGGSFELAMLEAGVVNRLHLNDLDTGIFSLWWTIKHAPYELIDRLLHIQPTKTDFYRSQQAIQSGYQGINMFDAAWYALIVNRLAYSGIAKANPLGGKNGSTAAMLSRWNPLELIKRIQSIHAMGDKIEVTQENAVELIEEAYWTEESTIFIDPPYVGKGKDLYTYYYTERDHLNLSFLLDHLYRGMPGANLLITYDYTQWVQQIYEYPQMSIIGPSYSI